MSNFCFISPVGHKTPQLYSSFVKTFEEQGHSIVNSIIEADVIFIDLHTRLSDYNQDDIDKLCCGEKPVVTFDEWDRGSMSNDEWPHPLTHQQAEVFLHLKTGIKSVHFCRKMDETISYPENVFPYEKCLYEGCDFPETTANELFSREYDIFFYGNTTPRRKSVTDELSKHFNCDFRIAQKNILHNEWVDRAKKSKLFLTADGAGFTDERMQQLITVSPMLKQKSNHKQISPFIDCVNCLMVSEQPTEEEIKGIKSILQDKEYLYEIYMSGIDYAKKYYSEDYRALYILKILTERNII